MNTTKHLFVSITLAVSILGIGTAGYMLIEDWNVNDAFYMTAITLSTVGYGEIRELGPEGRVFTVILILIGVGFSLYVAGAVVQFMVEGRIRQILGRRRLDWKLKRLKDHYIVCGYGRIGRMICSHLLSGGQDLVVIERDEKSVPAMESDGVLFVNGDAAEEINLVKAGIKTAKGLVAALGTDTENVFLVLTARQLNPDIYIVARSGYAASYNKLLAAGADAVESPYDKGAVSMAQRILRPTVTSFLDLAYADQNTDIQMEEIPMNEYSNLAGVMLKDSGIRQKFNLIIIAIKKRDGTMRFNPSFEAKVQVGDTVIAVGEGDNLKKLGGILNPEAAPGK